MTRPVGKNFDEQDAFTGWRKYYPYLGRAGVVKRIKRVANRRDRREGRDESRRWRIDPELFAAMDEGPGAPPPSSTAFIADRSARRELLGRLEERPQGRAIPRSSASTLAASDGGNPGCQERVKAAWGDRWPSFSPWSSAPCARTRRPRHGAGPSCCVDPSGQVQNPQGVPDATPHPDCQPTPRG